MIKKTDYYRSKSSINEHIPIPKSKISPERAAEYAVEKALRSTKKIFKLTENA